MSGAKKSNTETEIKISFPGIKSSFLFKLLSPKVKITGSSYFPEEVREQALAQWELMMKEPEVLSELGKVRKRKFLKGVKLKIGAERFGVKYYNYQARFWCLLESLFYQSEAERNFRLMEYLLKQGLLAPRPLLLLEWKALGITFASVLIMEDLEPAQNYKERIKELGSEPEKLRRFLQEIFFSLAQLNRTGLYSLDFDKNLLIKKQGEKELTYFIDFDNVYPFRKNNPRRAARTIYFLLRVKKIFRKLSPRQIKHLIDFYLGQIGKSGWREELLAELKKVAGRKDPEDLVWLKKLFE